MEYIAVFDVLFSFLNVSHVLFFGDVRAYLYAAGGLCRFLRLSRVVAKLLDYFLCGLLTFCILALSIVRRVDVLYDDRLVAQVVVSYQLVEEVKLSVGHF